MAKEETVEATPGLSVAEPEEISIHKELDQHYGPGQKPESVKPFEQLQDEGLTRVVRRPEPGDDRMSPDKWLKGHMQKVAAEHGHGAKASRIQIAPHESVPALEVRIGSRQGSISLEHIKALQETHNLDQIELAMKGFLSGFIPEMQNQ